MSVEETQQLISSYFDALLNEGDFARFFAEDVVWTTMETLDQIRGRDEVRDFIIALHSEMFDARPEVKNVIVGDGVVSLEAVFVGKHIADFAGVPATNAAVRVPYSVFYDIENGQITTLHAYFPVLALAKQLQDEAAFTSDGGF
ncbi:MAG TPA: ester cyclase [Nocardioidaceae bacterium]|nr:ester cyclase [Nocardioidaceae bacterium]